VKSRFLKVITSNFLTLTLVIMSYGISVVIFFIIIASDAFVCKFSTILNLRTVNTVELILIYAAILLALVFDIVSNFKMILQFKWYQYIFGEDPYYFRAQILLFLPFMLFSIISEFVTLGITQDYEGVVKYFGATIVLTTIQVTILLILDVLFPLVLTWFEMIKTVIANQRKIQKGGRKANILELSLQDEEILKMFIAFCQQQFSLENILCWQDIQVFKKDQTVNPLIIYFKYFNGGNSLLEVNIPAKISSVIKGRIAENKMEDRQVFNDAEVVILPNLQDTWSRFQLQKKYVAYVENKSSELKMLESSRKASFHFCEFFSFICERNRSIPFLLIGS
jgi:hypothetical protein